MVIRTNLGYLGFKQVLIFCREKYITANSIKWYPAYFLHMYYYLHTLLQLIWRGKSPKRILNVDLFYLLQVNRIFIDFRK